MKRRRWMLVAGGLAVLAVGAAWLLRPRPPEPFPLAELVPADAVLYLGFPDYRELDRIPTPWSEELRKQLDPARPHLAGPLAIYLDRSLQWVSLARLTRASAALAGTEVMNGAAVAAQTPEALARHKEREGSLNGLPEFRALGSRFFFNLERLKPRGRLRDFSAIGFDLQSTSPFVLKGRALYRGGLFRTYLEQYVHAPPRALAESAPFQASLTEYFPRIWEEITHNVLDAIDREKADRESQVLSRDYLEGRPFREFLTKLGPGCGLALVPTPHSRPALILWIDLADEKTSDLVRKMIHRAVNDGARVRKDRGLPPSIELADEGSLTRMKFAGSPALRLGEAFTPAYRVEGNRFVFSTCESAMTIPPIVAGGDAHAASTVEIGPLLDAIRSLAPLFADEEFRAEAERKAMALYLKTFTPSAMVALRKQYPDPVDLAKYQETQKAQFTARALEELSKTLPYQEELTRVKASIEIWADRVSWLERASWTSRFTSSGLEFELRAWPAPPKR